MRVTVLRGGPSAEREISLISGGEVAKALRNIGHDVFESDIGPDNLEALDRPADVIFPVLHGEWGEDGQLQEILESRGLSFVGSGSQASRLGMNKVAAKQAWLHAGLPTPRYELITNSSASGAFKAVQAPCVVKAVDSGSSIDVFICKTPREAQIALDKVLDRHGQALIEQFISGAELTVGLLEERPLPPIRIVAKRAFFDYEAKYKAADTEHRFDLGLPAPVTARIQELARRANAVIGATDLARVDIMLDQDHEPYLLEINTLPGFTPKSLLPEAAGHTGIPFGQLVDRLVKRALKRRRAAA